MSGYWYAPLDPDCPEVVRRESFYEDPFTVMSGCGDEFREDFERKHRVSCERCQEYGAANIEAVY